MAEHDDTATHATGHDRDLGAPAPEAQAPKSKKTPKLKVVSDSSEQSGTIKATPDDEYQSDNPYMQIGLNFHRLSDENKVWLINFTNNLVKLERKNSGRKVKPMPVCLVYST